MQRVSRLPSEQFYEVSNDLHDELKRRLSNSTDVPFLPIRAELPQKRNQARQKMATLHDNRFKELAAELFVEIERRFPLVVADVQQQTQSRTKRGDDRANSDRSFNSVSGESAATGAAATTSSRRSRNRREPSASSRRERDRSREHSSHRNPSLRSEESIGRLAARNVTPVQESDADNEIAKLRSDYEFKIAMMEKQLKDGGGSGGRGDDQQIRILQSQIAKMEQNSMLVQGDYDRLQADYDRLQSEYEQVSMNFTKSSRDQSSSDVKYQELENEFKQFRRDYEILQDDFEREQKITADLEKKLIQTKDDLKRLQADTADNGMMIEKFRASEASFLTDIQVLKEKARTAESSRDNLAKENARLRDELQRNKDGYSAAASIPRSASPANSYKAPLKSPGTVTSPSHSINTIREGEDEIQDPLYRDFKISSFDLIDAAKSSKREKVLGPMKNILLVCKEITQECEAVETSPDLLANNRKSLRESKSRLSESLSFLMQAAKEHASNNGPSILKKIEEEMGTLTHCVADVLKALKIVQRDPLSARPVGSNRDTLQSLDPPSAPASYVDGGGEPPALELPELLNYIKDQIDVMDEYIKDLLQVMLKSTTTGDDLSNFCNKIASCVDKIIYETQGTLDISTKMKADIIADADAIVADMGDINNELLDYGEDILDAPGDRAIKQKIANTSYEIAKQTKDLLSVLQQ